MSLLLCFRSEDYNSIQSINKKSKQIVKEIQMLFTSSELHDSVQKIFTLIGCPENDSKIVADVLISAEKRGIPSHGIIRIKDYLGLWEKGRINPTPTIKIIHETPSTFVIDGDLGLGMVVANHSMKLTIEKAQKSFTAWAAVRNSNHFGIAGFYSLMAAEHDMIGISMTNANSLVAPTFSIDRMLGTNPLAVAIPAGKEPVFMADFATTPIARGKLEILEKMNLPVSEKLVQDKEGNTSTDPSVLQYGGAILPLGGDREHGSHKGFCMAALIDIFSAVFSGANFGPFVPPQVAYLEQKNDAPGKGLGHFFGAMRIDAFQTADEFKAYMDLWITEFRKARTIEGIENLIIPGDPERMKESESELHGIEVHETILDELLLMLKKLSLPSPF
jgi:L-2-hydroxycarboxylate dehydrogenase (NAD+)